VSAPESNSHLAATVAAKCFAIEGKLVDVEPLLRGHINQTWISTWKSVGGVKRRYLHQRINESIFQQVDRLMNNIELVSRRLGQTCDVAGYKSMRLVPTNQGESWCRSAGAAWRTYEFVEETQAFDRCTGSEQAHATARIFGWFHASLADLDASLFHETIPHFFSPGHRWLQFQTALSRGDAMAGDESKTGRDFKRRRELSKDAIEFAREQHWLIELFDKHLATGEIPSRIVHGDTKLNNVLFDVHSGAAICVVDLDTCMPGFSLYDFGDMVRFTAATSEEDEPDTSLAGTSLEIYRALATGYMECVQDSIQPLERELLHLAGPLVSLVIGLRFLTDHLTGDTYFGASRENQNLDRARVQFAQVAHMEKMRDEMLGA
jgi:hypothetical protein